MAIIVQKFGGTSVGDTDRIKNVARRIKSEIDAGNQVAVVVSAMSGVTDKLVSLCKGISDDHCTEEYDTVVATGEQVTIGLLSMALKDIGIKAQSMAGWQIPMLTDQSHSKALIKSVQADNLKKVMNKGIVPIVAGFQGITEYGRVSTLGRGGSDTSAVAIAATLQADLCDIYTDVDGVYTSDPRIVSSARKLDKITFEEMLEMASLGAKVLQTRSVSMAMRHNVRVRVRSSFNDNEGTIVTSEDEIVEQQLVSGVTCSRNETKITLKGLPDSPGISGMIFEALAKENINVDMIVQTSSEAGIDTTEQTFTIPREDLSKTVKILEKKQKTIGFKSMVTADNISKVSVVGVGMRSHAGVAKTMFEALGEKGINIHLISTSEIKISVLISEEYTELAMRSLHSAYGLDK
ncbi:MAG: aspartate kinase [Alphaproteobacteria bacterium]|nr:aspartate kinase [Alphaproteobacteria bacterium]